MAQLGIFLYDIRRTINRSVLLSHLGYEDSLNLERLCLETNFLEQIGDLMVVRLELLDDEGEELERRYAVDIELARHGVALFDKFQGEEDAVRDPVHHFVMVHNGQSFKEMRRECLLITQMLSSLNDQCFQ